MDDEKKKRRNKKKKNKQNKVSENVVNGVEESASEDQNCISGQNNQTQAGEVVNISNDVEQNSDVNLDIHNVNSTESKIASEAEKPNWLNREASLQETIKQLQNDVNARSEKEAKLQETIKQLQNDVDARMEKEAGLNMAISQLQNEKNSLLKKEAEFEVKMYQLLDETSTLRLKGESLEEKIKELEREKGFWIEKENITGAAIAGMNDENARLQSQVSELEETRNNLLQENRLLMENLSHLQSHFQNIERNTTSARSSSVTTTHVLENEDLNSQIEAARGLVEKLMTENAELVEKVNELYVELDRHGVTGQYPSIQSNSTGVTAETTLISDPLSETSNSKSASGERMKSLEDVVKRNEMYGGGFVNANAADSAVDSSFRTSVLGERMESLESVAIKVEEVGNQEHTEASLRKDIVETINSNEIVQIPLDDNEVRDLESQTLDNDEKADVPLTDAPIIGAPFRFISFVAKYVAGADLVNKSSV